MRNYADIGVQVGEILIPRQGVDLNKWAVIACDQFTSQPDYWRKVEELVGDAPSTFNLTLPEIYLESPDEPRRIQRIQENMRDYLRQNLFQEHEGLILVERESMGRKRHGLMLALDLEHYDFNKGSQTLIRATEGTILERIPPRMRIREGALLELPHIMVLIDDPACTVIEPLVAKMNRSSLLYETGLMLGSGKLSAYTVELEDEQKVITALRGLADPADFRQRYGLQKSSESVLLFAMGDGNHSLATAKSIWEKIKGSVGLDHPARYALVEIENVHDNGLLFEPIHRVVFDVKEDIHEALSRHFGADYRLEPCPPDQLVSLVKSGQSSQQCAGCITPQGSAVLIFNRPSSNLAVGTLQAFLDGWLKEKKATRIDYVHGDDVVASLGAQAGNVGFYLPVMQKADLFKTVLFDGALPRKTFSMGEAVEKRFYMEARKIA
jgi:hypothetical protein